MPIKLTDFGSRAKAASLRRVNAVARTAARWNNSGRWGGKLIAKRCLLILAAFGTLGLGVRAQAADSTGVPVPQAEAPKFDVDAALLSSRRWTPTLNDPAATLNRPLLSGLALGGSTLNFHGDKKLPETLSGAETIEPETMMTKKQRRFGGPHYFGLSIKKPLE
jgi:hypothetical protein